MLFLQSLSNNFQVISMRCLCPFSTKCVRQKLKNFVTKGVYSSKLKASEIAKFIVETLLSPCDSLLGSSLYGVKIESSYIDALILTKYLFNTRCASSMPGRCRRSHQKPYQLFKVKLRLVRNRLRYPMDR